MVRYGAWARKPRYVSFSVGKNTTSGDSLSLTTLEASGATVAVLDIALPDGSGIEVCRDVRAKLPDVKCLILTSSTEEMALFDAVEQEIWRYAETGNARLHPFLRFAKHMRERFPFMNYVALRKAWGLAVFYTIHEGH